MLYFLLLLVVVAAGMSFLGILPYKGVDILIQALFLVTVCKVVNNILAAIFKAKTNPESPLITGFILSLIIGPTPLLSGFIPLTAVAVLAMASKYMIAWRARHIFNPAAFGVLAVALLLNQGASWWIGSLQTFPFVLLGGLLVLKKIRRWEMVGAFLLLEIATLAALARDDVFGSLLRSPILFFALVMLVEPLTSPTTKKMQILYGLLVAVFTFIISKLFSEVYYGLELSLLLGNIFSYIVSRSFRQVMVLKEKKQLTKDVIAFLFEPTRNFQFRAGQFLEWTLSHSNPDSRGVRRFFTISSSPTEDFVMLTSKFYEKPSTYKQALQKLEPGDEIVISGLGGEFTLPEDPSTPFGRSGQVKKLAFIAGGIGVTPFRSMVKWMLDNNEKRDVMILYSNKTEGDIEFRDIFDKAEKVGVSTIYVNTDKDGYIDAQMLRKQIPDYKERTFYVSGPEPMVEAFEGMLKGMGVAGIKRDYFPGYTETHQKQTK